MGISLDSKIFLEVYRMMIRERQRGRCEGCWIVTRQGSLMSFIINDVMGHIGLDMTS
jgi:hypothetical protein